MARCIPCLMLNNVCFLILYNTICMQKVFKDQEFDKTVVLNTIY